MLRELTKSSLSCFWALSLLGVKQVINLGKSSNNGNLFAPVMQVAVNQLDDSTKGMFRSGDTVQSRAVDLVFSWMNPGNWLNVANWGAVRTTEPCGGSAAPSGQAGPQTSGMPTETLETASLWMNPINWINPANWNAMLSRTIGNQNQSAAASSSSNDRGNGSQTGWGPM